VRVKVGKTTPASSGPAAASAPAEVVEGEIVDPR